jgi:histidine ammonia-lyase
MGTIAARDCIRVLELSEQVAAAMLVAMRQAMALRLRLDDTAPEPMLPVIQRLEGSIPFLDTDRALDRELAALVGEIRGGKW